MWNLNYDTNELSYKTEIDSQTQKTNLELPKGKGGGGGINQEFGISRYTPLYIKQINNNTGNYIQYPVINHNEKEYIYIYIYIYNIYIYIYIYIYKTESLCCIPETNTTL